MTVSRRDLFKLAGGALFVGCAGKITPATPTSGLRRDGFVIMQITDTHLGYTGPANPEPRQTIDRAIAEIAAWPAPPDLVIHTGDVSQLTPDASERRRRLVEAKKIFATLGSELHVIPGEHDASLDGGAAFTEVFGPTRWSFEHEGVYLIGIDNSSGSLGEAQLAWFDGEVAKVPASAKLLVFSHRPLFPLAQSWDWFTKDGDRALATLDKHPGTTVFYGHIHQGHVARTNQTTHVASRGLVFPLPAPMSVPERKPLPWDPAALDHGLGYRGIAVEGDRPVWTDRALVG